MIKKFFSNSSNGLMDLIICLLKNISIKPI